MRQFGVRTANLLTGTALAVLLASACGPGAQQAALTLEDGWIRAMPPGMKMTAGFGRWVNNGSDPIEIKKFYSPQFGDVSLHRTVEERGVSRMREVPVLELPPGSTVQMAPGGYHLMLMKPVSDPEPGSEVALEVTDADGNLYTFELPVERR